MASKNNDEQPGRADDQDAPVATRQRADRRPAHPSPGESAGEDVPAWRPDDEVPANRRDAPRRQDQDDEQEHLERRGS